MKKILKIDSEGYFIEDILIDDNTTIPKSCIETVCAAGFTKPKWNGIQWVEGDIFTTNIETEEQKKIKYNNLSVKYIREKYSSNDEYEILREKMAGTDTGSFAIYNTYIEECKAKAHVEVYGN